ncbi:non-ribosomal peptide synthetase, partial [Trinickia fusca]|uniref:non-ribosomal peptide synthetase n=1 Tax=Trinickia fusca TaxID=2419777 RepID=UPI0015FF1C13
MNKPKIDELQTLTAPQLEMWFAQQLEPQNPLFDSRAYVDIRGSIDSHVFEQALHRFIMDAQALHFHFVETSKGPMQLLGEPALPELRFVDVSGEADPFITCWDAMQAEASKLYDLLNGPLFSHMLFKLGDERYVWYQRYHHIVMDGASVSIAIDRVAQIYTALMCKQPVPAANFGSIEPMLQGDPAYRQSQRYANDRLYWHDYVATLPAAETVSGAPADSSGFFRRTSASLPVALGDKLAALEAQLGHKWPQVLTAIVAAYLFRVSNGRITVFDFPVAARTKETRALPGTFANILPLRLPMTGEHTLAELTQLANAEIFKHLKHQQFRVKEIKQMWGIAAGPIFGPRINIIPFENGWTFDGGASSIHSLANGLVNDFAVTVNGIPGHPACTLFVDGNAKLYDEASVEAHKRRLLHFIEAALADPWLPIGQIDLLDAEERRLLIETWNATDAPYPEHLCIHELVEAQAQRTPKAIALISGDVRLSYAELNAQANRLARHLLALGITPDTRVAVCLERSPAMVVALLAILKAGGAYVPLDPAYPSTRLAHILVDAAPAVIFVDPAGRHALGELLSPLDEAPPTTFTLIDLDAHASVWAAQPASNIGPHTLRLTSQHLAYVIYTSGSTGTPKGVMVEHRQLANLVTWHITRFHLRPGCQVPSAAGLAFDACTWEIWPALTSGATLLLAPAQCALDSAALLQWWRGQSMETAFLVTPLALLAMEAGLPDGLQHLLIGGDRVTNLPAGLPPSVQIVNNYGPTETTVVATSGVITPGEAVHSIGKPIANTRLYLLDEHRAPVPIGAVGELYIGGAGVARGYLNRPELTAQRFLPDPFARAAGSGSGSGDADADADADARMYRTGDLARYLPDGNLLFLGRNDDQVKIRGFRIELGEIEAQLAAHEAVREAVLVARYDAGGQARLLAYVAMREDARTSASDADLAQHLRAHLADRLPEYMLPAAFVVLDAMPLTANGKLDRRALPEPDDQAFAQAHTHYEAPQGEIETALASLWCELLTLDRVGRHDNFFSLGGHSLLAVQLIERLRRMGLALAIRDLFEHPGLAALARTLVKSADVVIPANRIEHDTTALTPALLPLIDLSQADIDCIVARVPEGVANIQDIYALSPLQDGILFHHAISTEGDPYLLSAHLAFRDRVALDRYLEAVQRVIERHDILRTAVVWEDVGTPAQVVWRRARLQVTELALDELISPVTRQLHGRFDPQRYRMDLTQAPLLHFAIAPAPDGRWHALMLLHHLVGDHTTLEILHEEVQAIENGQEHVLPKPQPYRNLVAQARLGMPAQAHETFFRSMLEDIDAPTLPYGLTPDHRGAAQVHEAQRRLPLTLHARLLAHARHAGVSLATLCHLAWALVLARTSGQRRVVFGTVLFGRMEAGAGADRAMGLYINTLPLRIDVDAIDVRAAVRETQMRLAALLAHEHASLVLAQRCSGVGTNDPLFSALLNYRHNAPVSQAENGPQLFGVELLAAHERTNYPLTLSVEDYGDALALTAQVVEPIDPHRICAYMQCALEQLADAFERTGTETGAEPVTLEHLLVVPEDERALLLATWNATDAPYPEHACLHQLVEAQVERTPDGTAVISGDERLSYAELNARAN